MDAHLRDLRYFLAVADELNFTRAAERLHLSQPALSKQVRGLEATLRVQLFRRDRRQVELTAAGAALQGLARDLLRDWDEGVAVVADAAAAEARVLRVGTLTSIGRDLYPAGAAIKLLSEGNAAIYARPGIVCIPVSGLEPARLAIAWRRGDRRQAVRDFVRACRDAAAEG